MNQTNTAGFDLDKPPETTDEARAYLDAWHRQNLPHAPFFSAYIKTELAGDFAYHMARWLARRAEPSVTAGDERALFKAHAKRQHLSTDGVTIKGRVVYSNNVTQADLIALASRRAQIVRDWLVNQGKIAAVRIFVVEPRVSAKTGEPPLQARVDFSLK